MNQLTQLLFLAAIFTFIGCSAPTEKKACCATKNDSSTTVNTSIDSSTASTSSVVKDTTTTLNNTKTTNAVLSKVYIYNFHVTNRCPSCVAIENATTKTLNTYFKKELQQGRIIRKIIDVDNEANAKIAEKYQAFGSGLFVTRSFKNKETTTDLTGDGFKFAKNKEDMFIDILKKRITNDLN